MPDQNADYIFIVVGPVNVNAWCLETVETTRFTFEQCDTRNDTWYFDKFSVRNNPAGSEPDAKEVDPLQRNFTVERLTPGLLYIVNISTVTMFEGNPQYSESSQIFFIFTSKYQIIS